MPSPVIHYALSTTTLIAWLATSLAGPALGQPLPGQVLRVIDGDSLVLDVRGSHYRIELADIDSPELNQPWGGAAAAALHRTLTGRFVVVQPSQQGFGHGYISLRGRDVALDLLHDGLAWAIPTTPRGETISPLEAAEQQAREAGRGLWSDPAPVAPWDWRAGRQH